MKKYTKVLLAVILCLSFALFAACKPSGNKDTFTVKFNANKPSGVTATVSGMPEAISDVEKDAKIDEPTAAPTLNGYTFEGWFKEAACTNA